MKKLTALLAGALLTIALTTAAYAIPTLRLSSGGSSIEITGTYDAASGLSIASYNGALGAYNINVTTGFSDQTGYTLDLNSVDVSNSLTPAALSIGLSDTNFDLARTGYDFLIGGTTQGTITYSAYYDFSNQLFGTANLIGTGTSGPGAFSFETTTPNQLGAAPYSLTELIEITHPAGRNIFTSFDAQITPVPEPGTMVLLGSGLLVLAIYSKRRKNA